MAEAKKDQIYLSDEEFGKLPASQTQAIAEAAPVADKAIPGVTWKPSANSWLGDFVTGAQGKNAVEPTTAAQILAGPTVAKAAIGAALPVAAAEAAPESEVLFNDLTYKPGDAIARKLGSSQTGAKEIIQTAREAAKTPVGRRLIQLIKQYSVPAFASYEAGKKVYEAGKKILGEDE